MKSRLFFGAIFVAVLTACNGGGGGSVGNPPPTADPSPITIPATTTAPAKVIEFETPPVPPSGPSL